MIKPQQVPDLFEEFRKIRKGTPLGAAHVYGLETSRYMSAAASVKVARKNVSDQTIREYAQTIADSEFDAFQKGIVESSDVALYYCDEDMSEMVEMGAKVLEHEDVAETKNAPSHRGFCYFAEGLSLSEGMMIHAISWVSSILPDGDGIEREYLITGYNDRFNESDRGLKGWEEFFKNIGAPAPTTRWVFRGSTPYRSGDSMGPTKELTDSIEEISGNTPVSVTPSYVFHALVLMLQQPAEIVTISKKEVSNKKQTKRLKAKNIPSEVTIIDIRHKYRSVYSSASTTDREYSRRWLVTGHWRWQPMKDRETGLAIRKRIWVNPYIKGPADKPFVATKRVHALLK